MTLLVTSCSSGTSVTGTGGERTTAPIGPAAGRSPARRLEMRMQHFSSGFVGRKK
jgi:hypothetical protein